MDKILLKARKNGIYVKTFNGIVFFKPEDLLVGIKKKAIVFAYLGKNYYVELFTYGHAWALTKEELS